LWLPSDTAGTSGHPANTARRDLRAGPPRRRTERCHRAGPRTRLLRPIILDRREIPGRRGRSPDRRKDIGPRP
jgi:hypothetical protein